MPPQQPGFPQQPQSPQQPNYDFIMNPSTPPPRRSMGDNSMAKRALVVVGGAALLIIVAGIVINLLGNSGKAYDKAAMLSVAQDQTELIRLSTTGAQDSTSESTKNFSFTTKLGIKSEQQALLTYLGQTGYTPNAEKELILKQSAATDQQLSSAKSASNFDVTYKDVMLKALQTYQADLTAAYDGASDEAKSVLSKRYDAADLLKNQLEAGN